MIDYKTIKINGKKIPHLKTETKEIYRDDYKRELIGKKQIYELPIELFEEMPVICNINNKKFYKPEIKKLNQTHFKLIEM